MTSKSTASVSRALVAILAAAISMAGSTGAAEAKKKNVVLMQFKGPKAKVVRKSVLKVLKKKVALVGEAKFKRMQKKLRAKKINARDVAKVSQRLKVHGVVFGRVLRKRGRYKLELTVRAGADGEVAKETTITLGKRPRVTREKERQIRKALLGVIDDLPEPKKARAKPKPEPEPEPDVEEEDDSWEDDEAGVTEEDIGGGGGGGRRDDAEEEEEEEERISKRDDDDEGEDEPAGNTDLYDALARDRAIDVAAGLSVIGRSLSFDVTAGIADTPNGYNGTIVPGAYVNGELYPLSFDHKKKKKGPLAGLGASFVVDKVIKISSKLEGGTVDIPTSQLRWGVGVRYRINLGNKPSSPTVKLGVGYNKLAFELDQQVIMDQGLDIDLPNVTYTYLDPGVAGRLPVNRAMALYADGRFLIITDTGDIQGPDAYGAATVSGLDFDAGLEYRFDARLLMRAGIRYQRITFAFDGNGALSDRDGDATSDVTGATDQYFGGYATAGYLF